jgi:hypothetical protein
VGFVPDLSSLDHAATRLEQHASEVRSRAVALAAVAATVIWTSGSADLFRHQNDSMCAALRRCADQLDGVAFTLRRHAASARHRAVEGVALVTQGGAAALDTGEHLVAAAWRWAGW